MRNHRPASVWHSASVTLAFALMLAGGRARAQSSAPPPQVVELDLRAYESELDRCAEAIQHPEEIPQLRKSLARTWRVRTQNSEVDVPTDRLTADLRYIEQNPTKSQFVSYAADLRLAAMRRAATELENPANDTDPKQARQHLDQILQRREFAGATGPSQFQMFMARVERWIVERLVWLFSRLHLGANAGNFLAWTIVVLAFLALAYWVWKNVFRTFRAPSTPVAGPTRPDDARLWARDARAAAERGDYREAVHCAYWAAIVHLEGLGLLKRDRARTPRESLRLLEHYPKEQRLLAEFTRHFELIWYGYRPASPEDWSGARAHLENMGCLSRSTGATANS
jgi:hypothetical protein